MLVDLIDDLVIQIISGLDIPDIISLRLTCRRLCLLSKLRVIWMNACRTHILGRSLPFPTSNLDDLANLPDLERVTRHAFALSERWMNAPAVDSQLMGREILTLSDPPRNGPILDIKFIPGHNNRWLLTVTRCVWDILTIWDMERPGIEGKNITKSSEWCPKRALFKGVCLNSDAKSRGTLAIAVVQDRTKEYIQILSLKVNGDQAWLVPVTDIRTSFRPMTLESSILAFSNDTAQTVIWDWESDKFAVLQHSTDEELLKRYDLCAQVLLLQASIIVARSRSLYLFPFPELCACSLQAMYEAGAFCPPLDHHSFGWVDGVSLALNVLTAPRDNPWARDVSILIRAESEDLWVREQAQVELYTLEFNPECLAFNQRDAKNINIPSHIFPPTKVASCPSVNGPLRCPEILLGSYGTAVWILPTNTSNAGLVSLPFYLSADTRDSHLRASETCERLVATVFPQSPLFHEAGGPRQRTLYGREADNWSAMAYDEINGRVALGTTLGLIQVIGL